MHVYTLLLQSNSCVLRKFAIQKYHIIIMLIARNIMYNVYVSYEVLTARNIIHSL